MVPVVVTTVLPPTTTTTRHCSNWMVAFAAGTLILVSGTVLMQDISIMNATKGLVVATEANILPNEVPLGNTPCLLATNGFSEVSKSPLISHHYPFQTCFQLGNDPIYLHNQHCYTNSYYNNDDDGNDDAKDGFWAGWYGCKPNSGDWFGIDTKLPGGYCDELCHAVHQG